MLGLPDNKKVQTFQVVQSWSLQLYLVVAYEQDQRTSSLVVYKPFSPSYLKSQSQSQSQSLDKCSGDRDFGIVENIFIASPRCALAMSANSIT